MFRVCAVLVVSACCAHPPAAAPRAPATAGTTAAVLGETFTLDSKILGERRTINVYLPPDYAADAAARYPVLYMPDGGTKEDFPHVVGSVDVSIKDAVIRPVIVVGIENTDRRHDLTGVTVTPEEQKAAPRAGGADNFRRFLRDELKPAIAARYRTGAESALIGESLAGLFVLDTLLAEPTLVDDYIAADPSVQWNEQAVVRGAVEHLAGWPGGAKQLYIATGDLTEMQDGVAILTGALRMLAPAGLTWTYEPMPEEHHNTIFAIAALRGIRFVFALPTE